MWTKNKIILWLLICISVVLSITILCLLQQKDELKNEIKKQKSISNEIENSYLNLEETAFNMIKYGSINISRESVVKDENGTSIQLNDLLKGKKRNLVIRISKRNCISCIMSFMSVLQDCKIDKNDILYITDYEKKKEREYFKNILGIDKEVYATPCLSEAIEKEDIPYAFILNEDLTVQNLFIPLYDNDNLSKMYIEFVDKLLRTK